MIDFILDVSQDLIAAILNERISSDRKSKCIRAYIDFYDSLKSLELQSEKFLTGFEEYINANDRDRFDLSKLRILIRGFSSEVFYFVETFRKYMGSNIIEISNDVISNKEIIESFTEIGSVKSMTSRSLLENASPYLCTNVLLPSVEQRYHLSILNYEKYKYSTKEVQKFWKFIFAYFDIKDLLTREHHGKNTQLQFKDKKWVIESRIYENYLYRYQYTRSYNLVFREELVRENETGIRYCFDCKIVSFDDIEEIDKQIKRSRISLERLRQCTKNLEHFLCDRFVVSDFFSES